MIGTLRSHQQDLQSSCELNLDDMVLGQQEMQGSTLTSAVRDLT